ncbi:S4 domain-containing protein [Candidatus Vidania fulgoroideae]|nr:S4 domain-containing protein [Candidatus Vidania fulgoroideae]WDR79253.1 S4 domain-containing protein [Candidatus Vidania fulgoroideae]
MRRIKRIKTINKYGKFINGFFLNEKKTKIKDVNKNRIKEYSFQLYNKQKIKKKFLIKERQFKKMCSISKKKNKPLICLIEKRFDNIIYISGYSRTRFEAKQIINHKYFLINKNNNNISSTILKIGDKIELKKKFINYDRIIKSLKKIINVPNWLNINKKKNQIEIIKEPDTFKIFEKEMINFYIK